MERAWAGLLSNPLTLQETRILNQSISQLFDAITDGCVGHFTYDVEMLTDDDEHLKNLKFFVVVPRKPLPHFNLAHIINSFCAKLKFQTLKCHNKEYKIHYFAPSTWIMATKF